MTVRTTAPGGWRDHAARLHEAFRDLIAAGPPAARAEARVPPAYFRRLESFHRRAEAFRASGGRIRDLRRGVFLSPPDRAGNRRIWVVGAP